GEKSTMTIQVGTNDNEVIEFKLDKVDNDTLGVATDKLFETTAAGKAKSEGAAIDATAADAAVSGATGFGPGIKSVTKYQEDGTDVANKFVVTKDDGSKVVASLKEDSGKAVINAEDGAFKATDGKAKLDVKDDALATLDKAINTIDESRSKLGAIQNRFESTINNLNNTVN
ncbi:flagellin, partial [Proteus mirabilis]|uniref:flagellin n=4 Tax=Morganellaceae TaxID=1903414 RepID=UPI0034D6942F